MQKPIRNLKGLQSTGNVYIFPHWAREEYRKQIQVHPDIERAKREELIEWYEYNVDVLHKLEDSMEACVLLNLKEDDPQVIDLDLRFENHMDYLRQIIHTLDVRGWQYHITENGSLEIPLREIKGK